MFSIQDLRRESAEVYYGKGTIARADAAVVDFLKREAAAAPRRRCRLCLHASPEAHQQEMLIVMHRDSFVVPHRHVGNDETMLVLEGNALAPIFDDHGGLAEVIPMGPPDSGRTFLYHMPEGVWHGLEIDTDWLVYVETTIGPFRREATGFPPWAPGEKDLDGIVAFRSRLTRAIGDWQARQPRGA
jgi:cupin fold WbuC family metalloprotein